MALFTEAPESRTAAVAAHRCVGGLRRISDQSHGGLLLAGGERAEDCGGCGACL